MQVREYLVKMPLHGSDDWFQICRCTSPESAGEVVRALLSTADPLLTSIKVDVVIVEKLP